MIWTISSRTSPRPPGNWCDARRTVGAASAEPAPSASAAIPMYLKLLMTPLLQKCRFSLNSLFAHRRPDLRGHPELVLDRHHARHRHHDARCAVRLVAGRDDAAHAYSRA